MVGDQFDGPLEIGQRRFQFAQAGVDQRAGASRPGVVRGNADGFVEIGQFLLGVLFHAGAKRQRLGPKRRFVGGQLDRLVQRFGGPLGVSAGQPVELGDQQQRLHVFRLNRRGLVQYVQGRIEVVLCGVDSGHLHQRLNGLRF